MKVFNGPEAHIVSDKTGPVIDSPEPVEILTSSNQKAQQPAVAKWQILLNLFGATFGISSLGIPIVVAQTGVGLFFVVLLIALLINYVSYRVILTYAEKHNLNTFSEFTEVVGGRFLRHTVNVLFFLCNLGTMIGAITAFHDIMALVSLRLGLTFIYGIDPFQYTWIIIPVMGSLPLTLKHKLKNFNWITWLSLVACLYLVILLVVHFLSIVSKEIYFSQINFFDWQGISEGYSYLFYCFTCQLNLIGIFRETKQTSFNSMKPSINTFAVSFGIIYALIGIAGYLIFCSKPTLLLQSQVIFNLMDYQHEVVFVANLLMAFTAFNAYLYTFKPTKEVLIDLFNLITNSEQNQQEQVQQQDGTIDQPVGTQLVQPDSQNDPDVANQSVFELKNLAATLIVVALVTIICCVSVKRKIGFKDVLDLISLLIIPILFVFIPLGVYLRDTRKSYLVVMLVFAGGVYLWKVIDLISLSLK